MKRSRVGASGALVLSLLSTAAMANANESPRAPAEKRAAPFWTWDANVEGGLGALFEDRAHLSGFGRVRGGFLRVDERSVSEPRFLALGLTYELSDFSPATFGIEVETLGLASGAWLQLGALVDVQPRPGAKLALGWSLFGVEGQVRWDKDDGVVWAAYGKLRVPVGILGWALSSRR
ncbi:hypothetical protein [Polyangium jinanense]|uniref:Outer membrane protein beta-barrel domain-containing protein n=1 Tax=Polyangium jinanense TaxID=2829994 RepID=A0A9X3X0Q0_9BACT|nr:hypothetical protein [Polyangium jinanense]MDC3952460.1 hypothetical protein [Polyangium jinanense]MDC3980088.1 hypothetical protein [Polyangium jinanense]